MTEPLLLPEGVRVATRDDEPEIVRLLHLMHAESGMFELDIQCAREMFGRAFNRQGGIIGVIGKRFDIHAMIYLLVTRFWYTRENHIEELFNFVRPDHRQSNHARTLIEFAKRCSNEIAIPLSIGVLTNHRMESKVRLYQRSLGFPKGAFFVYRPHQEAQNETLDDFWKRPFSNRIINGALRAKCAATTSISHLG